MAKGRKPTDTTIEAVGPTFGGATPVELADQEASVRGAIALAHENAQAVALELNYEGNLTVGALEDEIRFYQRRSVEACLELGKRLLILKELTPHGEFIQRIELLGISKKMGNKFMAATLKFAKGSAPSLLTAAGNQSKLLELLILDEDEIEALENGDSVRGITIDEISTMSMRDLRSALLEANEKNQANERLLAEKNAKIDELSSKPRRKGEPWPDEVAGIKDDIHGHSKVMDECLGKLLTLIDATEVAMDSLPPESDAFGGYKTVVHHMGETVERLATLVAGLRDQYATRLGGLIELDKSLTLDD